MRFTLIAIVTIFAIAGPASAQKGKGTDKAKRAGNMEGAVEQAEGRAQEARDKMRGDKRMEDDGSSDDYKDDEQSERSSDDDSRDGRSDDDSDRRADDMRGNAKAEEMRNRRDERKQIKEEYRADREPGQERATPSDESPDGESAAKKAKKPWWKFWEE